MASFSREAFLRSPQFKMVLGAVVALLVIVRFFERAEPAAVEVKGELIENHEIAAETSGRIQPLSEVFVSVKRGGRLDRVLVQPGTEVTKDQLIAVIDESFHTSAVQSALSNYRLASAELGRLQSLFRSSAATAQEMDQARNTVAVRRSELEQARQKLEDGLVRAPVAGILSILPFAIGETLPDGARVAVIEDRSAYRLRAILPLAVQKYLAPQVEVRFWRYGTVKPAVGDMPSVACEAIQTPIAQSVGSGDFDIELRFTSLPGDLKSGDLTNIRLPLRTLDKVMRVPSLTLQHDGAQAYVLTADDDDHLHKVNVEVIEASGDTAIIHGLELDDKRRLVAPLLPVQVREALAKNESIRIKPL